MRGRDAIVWHRIELCGSEIGEVRDVSRMRLEPIDRRGLCAIDTNGPVDGVPFGRLNASKLADVNQRSSL